MILKEFNDLVEMLRILPGVSLKQANKIVNFFLSKNNDEIEKNIQNFLEIIKKIKNCNICNLYSIDDVCDICNSKSRSKKLMIVENKEQIQKYESWNIFDGKYYCIPILFNKKFELTNNNFSLDFLLNYISEFDEIILALSPTPEGVITSNFIFEKIKAKNPKKIVSKLSIGIPMGSSIDYMDQLTISYAIKNRKDIE